MNNKENQTVFKCKKCGNAFKATQGSRRTLCAKCLEAAMTGPKPRKEEVK